MKRIVKCLMALAIALMPCVQGHAQQATAAGAEAENEERPFWVDRGCVWNNWFLSFEGGPSFYQGDHNVDSKFKDRIYPAFDLSVGKWILPALGIRLGTTFDNVHTQFHRIMTPSDAHHAEPYGPVPDLSRMHYRSWNIHGDIMFNVSSLFWKNHNRVWNLVPYVGLGCIGTWDGPWDKHSWSLNVGILNTFRVCEQVDINLDIHAKDFHDRVNYVIQGHHHDGIFNLMVGLTWHFTKRGFTDNLNY